MQHREISNLPNPSMEPKNRMKQLEINHSDHYSINVNLETELETIPIHRPWNKADWEMFRKELTDKQIYVPNKITPQRLEKMLDQFYKQIERAFDKACPKQKEIIISKNNPWHKGTLKQLRIEKFARYEKYIQDRNHAENKNKYYQTLAKYRKPVSYTHLTLPTILLV